MNLEEYIYLNYDDEDSGEELVEQPQEPPAAAHDPFTENDRKFKRNYRVTKPLAEDIIDEVTPVMKSPSRASDMTVAKKVLVALNFFATGSYQNQVANHKNAVIDQSSVSNSLSEVVDALNHPTIFNKLIKFPRNEQEMDIKARRFFYLYGLPGVTGCIDCTHVAIVPPDQTIYDERSYVNRKGYHSINTQLICDADLEILNVNALFPGSTHDSFVWNQSAVLPVMERIHAGHGRHYLIGDSGYGLRPWLLTPIPDPVNRQQEAYNRVFKSARATIERCNGVLKTRFRCLLKHRVLHYTPEKAIKIINSCCVLHNMCLRAGVEVENDDMDEIENADFGLYEEPIAGRGRNRSQLAAGQAIRNNIVNNYF